MSIWTPFFLSVALIGATLPGGQTLAAEYPTQPIRLIVPFPTGTSADVFARTIGQRLQKKLGQTVVVENKPGANGLIGVQALAKAEPDGYTIGLGSNGTHGINTSLFTKLPYDPTRDFAPIIKAYSLAYLLLSSSQNKANKLAELVAEMRASPDPKRTIGSTATGAQLSGELLRLTMNLPLERISYKTQATAVADLVGGRLDLMMDTVTGGRTSIATGRVKGLAVTSAKRSSLLPDVPTVAESGQSQYESTAWVGLFAPAQTPAPIITRLNTAVNELLKSDDIKKQLLASGIEPIGGTPNDLRISIKTEIATWQRVFKEADLPRMEN